MNILSFDIEEWFHILDEDSTKTEKEWSNFESRIHKNMDTILQLCEKHQQKATFFCLGWVAEKYPEVIKNIQKAGHEIGTHSHLHQLAYEQSEKEYAADLDRSIDALEQVIGSKVTSYRCPGFSIVQHNLWALDVLAEKGIETDSSIFPASRNHGGISDFGVAKPLKIQLKNGLELKEFPINTHQFMGKDLIFSGGGYFRLAPYWLIKRWTQKADYVMTYFHPRDFDPGQPVIEGLSAARRFKSYIGLRRAEQKLDRYLTDFSFLSLEEASSQIDWGKVKVKNLV